MPLSAVLGAQWGDEGKGKVAAALTTENDICARYQGGCNAGHTILIEGTKVTMRCLPAASLGGAEVVLGAGLVIDPPTFLAEVDRYHELTGMPFEAIRVSGGAHVLLPRHRAADAGDQAKWIGTSGWGNGPAARDKYARVGIRVQDVLDGAEIPGLLPDIYRRFRETLEICVTDVSDYLFDELSAGRHLVTEGAQGASLDIDTGDYPFVTSSTTTIGGVFSGLGVAPIHLSRTVLVASSYCTKLGAGQFPSKLTGEEAEEIQRIGNEWDHDRRVIRDVGWFDAGQVRRAIRINGCTDLVLTKVDILGLMPGIRIYDGKDEKYSLRGWNVTGDLRDWSDLPAALRHFLDRIEDLVLKPVSGISYGPSTGELLWR